MRILERLKLNNKLKKSHILTIGSFLVFIGVGILSWNYLLKIKEQIYSDMNIAMMGPVEEKEKTKVSVPLTDNLPTAEAPSEPTYYEIDYSQYLGVLEIPKIGLKRGFYNIDSRYNNIRYNVTMVRGSSLPDIPNGNLILMAHSGDAYISFFAYLYKLVVGDYAYVTYGGAKYTYQIVNIYTVPKTGVVSIKRNYQKTSLTLITCTKDSDTLQTVYIAELV